MEAGRVNKQHGCQAASVGIGLDGKILTTESLESFDNEMKKLMERMEVIDNRVDRTKSRLWIVSADGKQLLPSTGSIMKGIRVGRSQEVEVQLLNNKEQQVEVGENEVRLEIDYGLPDNHSTLPSAQEQQEVNERRRSTE
jgi:hypothetical protein